MVSDIQELPETGEIVIATVTKISDHGAYVTLDEYNKIQGFLHVSEIAPGWVRKVNKYVREGEKKVLLVKKVERGRKEIDLSLNSILDILYRRNNLTPNDIIYYFDHDKVNIPLMYYENNLQILIKIFFMMLFFI